jgi:diguanylate cyclase (GGDEF)-like protein
VAEPPGEGGPGTPEAAAAPPRAWLAGGGHRWLGVAGGILALGLALSLAGALLWRSSVRAGERENFQTKASDVSETLRGLVLRDTDLLASLRAVLTMQPHLSASGFRQWFEELERHHQAVGGFGAVFVRSVPSARLASFLARRDADPAFRAGVRGRILPVPATGRGRYCLLAGATSDLAAYSPELATALQGDWCDPSSAIGGYQQNGTTRAKFTQLITDSGQFVVYTVTVSAGRSLALEAAFYRRGAPLTTVAQRRAAGLGWVAGSFDIPTLIGTALGKHRNLAVTLYHSNLGGHPEFVGRVGAVKAQPFSNRATLSADGTWIVTVTGAGALSGPPADVQALLVLLAGLLMSVLLAALVLVLARTRERALAMVDEKTGQLRHQALHDGLTGLPNRVLALDRTEQMLARARRQHVPVAALYVDIDGFKHVNDTYGHAAGDEFLRTVATRLQSVVREGDTAARLSGDEFVVLVEGSTLDAGPELVAERLLDVLRRPYDINGEIGRELSLTASVGIASGLRASADQLLRDADIALYEAKAAGKNRYVVFRSDMQTAAFDRLTLEMDLAEALEHDELALLYQPTFDLRSEDVIGVEALIRWHHPIRGVLAPDQFIPIAEESGLIVPIGRWVLQKACRQAATWRRRGHAVGMAVNVAARQLEEDALVDEVRDALQASGLQPAALTLEVTETTLMRDPEATAGRLHALKRLGVRIAIDDFGTGYSSLAYLRQFPADAVKIDRSFISDIAATEQSTALIHTLVQLGKTLHIETLAEGIEDQVQLRTLQREQCDQGQGFLFSRPLDVAAIETFLQSAQDSARAPAVHS